jgi:hypothetical protein
MSFASYNSLCGEAGQQKTLNPSNYQQKDMDRPKKAMAKLLNHFPRQT